MTFQGMLPSSIKFPGPMPARGELYVFIYRQLKSRAYKVLFMNADGYSIQLLLCQRARVRILTV